MEQDLLIRKRFWKFLLILFRFKGEIQISGFSLVDFSVDLAILWEKNNNREILLRWNNLFKLSKVFWNRILFLNFLLVASTFKQLKCQLGCRNPQEQNKKIHTFYLSLLLNICSSENLTIRPRIDSFIFLLIRFSISNHFDIPNHLMRWGEFISIWMDCIRFSTSGTISSFFKGWVISKSIFNFAPSKAHWVRKALKRLQVQKLSENCHKNINRKMVKNIVNKHKH